MAQAWVSWIEFRVPDPAPFGKGCPPGSVAALFPAFPYVGPPVACPTGTCGNALSPPELAPLPALLYRWCGPCAGRVNVAAPAGTRPDFASPALSQPTEMLRRWREETRPTIPGIRGVATIDPGRGNLNLALAPPDEGPATAAVALVYNSQSVENPALDTEIGRGWTICPKRVITPLTETALDLAYGDGTVLRYDDFDGVVYRNPGGSAESLRKNPDESWTQTAADGSRVHFNSGGLSDYLESPTGNRWTLTYSGENLTGVTDPFGRVTQLDYAAGRLARITQPSGRVTTVTVNGAGDLVKVTRPDGTDVTLEYEGHRLTAVTDPEGNTTRYGYVVDEDGGHVASVTDASGARTTFTYALPPLYETTVTDSSGRETLLEFSRDGNLEYVTDPLLVRVGYLWENNRLVGYQNGRGEQTAFAYADRPERTAALAAVADAEGGRYTFAYDGSGRVTQLVDQNGNGATLTWSSGERSQVVDQSGGVVAYRYNGYGQVTGVTDPTGRTWTMTYDAQGNVAGVVDPAGSRTSFTYDARQQVVAVTDPLGRRASVTRDAMNRVTATVDPLGNQTGYRYDLAGNPVSRTDPLGRRTTQVYDNSNRVQASIDPAGSRTTYGYSARGQLNRMIDPLGRITSVVYDPANRPAATIDPLGARTTTGYDGAGNPVSRTDPLGRRTTQVYNRNDRLAATVDPLSHRVSQVYDPAGQVVATVDPLGRRSSTVYDASWRAIATINALGQRSTTVYDAAGRPTSVIDPLSRRTSTVYDPAGRSIASVNPLAQRTSTVYDAAGETVATVDPLSRRTSTVYDPAGRSIASVNPLAQRTSTVYDAAGQARASVDPLSRRTSTVYDPAGRAIASINPLAQRTTTVYDAAGETVATVDPLSRRTSTVYDPAGRAIASINPLAQRTTTVYDAAGETVATVDPLSRRTSTVYDPAGRSIASVNPLAQRTSTVYDAAGQARASVDPLSRRTSTVYDPAGRSIASVNPLAQRTSTVYDAAGQARASVDPLSRRTSTVYDPAGRAIASINPLAQRTTTVYDAAGETVATVDPLSRRTSTVYDPAGRSIASVNPLAQRTSTVYDAAGETVATVDPLSRRTSTVYDPAGRSIASVNPLAQRTSTVYDAAGETVATVDPLSRRTSTVYDPAGRSIASVNPLAQRTSTVYDAAGQARASVDPLSRRTSTVYDPAGRAIASINPLAQRTSTVYDAAGQARASVNALGYRTTWAYDVASRRVRLTDARGNATTLVYDAAGQDVGRIDPLLRRTTQGYDPAGRLTSKVDGRLLTLTYDYDPAGQPVRERRPDGTRVTFAYDPAGRRVLVADPTGRTTTAYDPAGQVSAVAHPHDTRVSYAYDPAGRRRVMRDPDGGRTTYAHDPAGQLVGLVDPRGGRTTFGYDPAGREARKWLANGTRVTQAYDPAGQLTLVHTGGPAGTVGRRSYTYDGAGRRETLRAADGVRTTWTYDPAGQLTRERRSGAHAADVAHAYDPAGNRSVQQDGGVRTTYTYDVANQLTAEAGPDGPTTYQHDAAGNRTRKDDPAATTYYAWDASSRLVAAEPVAGVVSYAYDGTGRRVGKVAGGETTRYVWDGEKVLREVDGSGATGRQYLSTDQQYGDLVSAYGGETGGRYYAFDALGSAEALLDDTGSPAEQYSYRAFGLVSSSGGGTPGAEMPLALPAPLGESGAGGSAEPYTWVGRQGYQRDTETGFYFLRARMYDPSSGRFVLPDPIGFAAGDANLYRYCGNDPVNHTDPSGLDSNGFGLTDLFFPLPSLAGRLARRDDVRRGAAAAVEGVGQLGRRALDQIPGFQAAVTAVRPCASRLLRDAPGATSSARDFVLGLARTGIPSVGGFARFARPPLTAAVPGLVALAQVPTQDILGLMDRVLRHECTQLLARVAAGVTPQPVAEFLQVLQDRGAGIFQAFQDRGAQVLAWAQALWDTLVARALNILQEIWDYVWPLVQKAPEALRAIGRFAARTAVEGPRKPVGQAIQTLIGLADGPTAKDVIGRIGVYLDGVLPEWQLPEEWVAFVADLFDDLVAAVGDKAGALVELIERPDEVFDSLLGTLRELAWPWGPPLSEQGIIPDFRALLNDAVPKVVTNLWGVWVGGLSCPASLDLSQWLRPLSEAVENAARGGLAVVAFIRDTAARLSGWLAVFGQVVGVLFPGAGNALAGGVNTVVNTLGTVFSTGLDLVEVADAVAGLWRLYEAEDEGDEAAVDRLEELEERLGEAGALGAATAGGWWGGAAGGAAGGLDRDVLVNKLLDTAIQAGVATLLAVVGGAGQRLGRRLAAKLRRVRVPRTSAAARRARKKMRRDMKRGQCCADKARAGVPCCDQRRECPIPRRPRRGGPIPVRPGQCFAAGTVVWARGGERVGVEAVRLGDRVATWLPGEPGAGSGGPDGIADPSGWRAVWLAQEDGEGGRLEVGLLRPAGWLSARGVEGPGGEVELDLPEMGAAGPFAVVEVGPCPAVTPGPGRVVTGLFRHRAGLVYDLRVGGEGVGVTGAHPVWSADRAGWVGAGDLLAGERVLGAGGPVVVAGMGERGEEPVYNLEVDVDHCFRVGTQGILVHNASTPCSSLGQRRRRYSYKVVRIPERRGSPNHVNERVVERAVSWIRPSDFSGGSYADGSAQDWVQHVVGVDEAIAGHIDHAGHVIAREFGGSGHLGQLPLNIFPQNAQVNTDEGRFWKRREIEIRGLFRRGCPMVCVRIMLRYDPNSRYPARPTFLVYDLWVNGTQRPTAQGDNPE